MHNTPCRKLPFLLLASIAFVSHAFAEDVEAAGPQSAPESQEFARSSEGFKFPDTEAAADYDARKLRLEVLNAGSSAWQSTETSYGPGSAQSETQGVYSTAVRTQYRIATGEGLVLAELDGELLYKGSRLFAYMGLLDVYRTHGRIIGEPQAVLHTARIRRTALLSVAAFGALSLTSGMALASAEGASVQRESVAAPLGLAVIGFGGLVWGGLGAARIQVPELEHFLLTAWSIEEILPHVRHHNRALRLSLGSIP